MNATVYDVLPPFVAPIEKADDEIGALAATEDPNHKEVNVAKMNLSFAAANAATPWTVALFDDDAKSCNLN